MHQTYQQIYRQTQGLELDLADMLGYGQEKRPVEHKEKKQVQGRDLKVAGITLRKFGKEVPQTEKMKQIDNEIGALRNERMLRDIREKQQKEPSLSEKSEIIKLMESKIEEYNKIVEHKHLRRSSEEEEGEEEETAAKGVQSVLNMGEEDQGERIIKEINRKKKQLATADLTNQIKLNRHIAKLYKEYQRHSDNPAGRGTPDPTASSHLTRTAMHRSAPPKAMRKDHSGDHIHKMSLSTHPRKPNRKLLDKSSPDLRLQPPPNQSYLTDQAVHKYKEKEYRKAQASRKRTNGSGRSNPDRDFSSDMKEPYLVRAEMDKFKAMENIITNGQDALEIWKGKVGEATMKASHALQRAVSFHEQNIALEEQDMREREDQFESILSKEVKLQGWKEESYVDIFKARKVPTQPRAQRRVDLQSPSNKFNRLWGKRMQVEVSPADNLSIHFSKQKSQPHRSQSKQSRPSTPTVTPQPSALSSRRSKSRGGAISRVMGEEEDEEHYWRMCKNEKMNLLLKRR